MIHRGEGTTIAGRLLNLSLGGCAIESAAPMDSGLYIALKISLTEEDQAVHIEMGRVQWATHHQSGVKFILLDKHDRQALER